MFERIRNILNEALSYFTFDTFVSIIVGIFFLACIYGPLAAYFIKVVFPEEYRKNYEVYTRYLYFIKVHFPSIYRKYLALEDLEDKEKKDNTKMDE